MRSRRFLAYTLFTTLALSSTPTLAQADDDDATFAVGTSRRDLEEGQTATVTAAVTNDATFAEDKTIALSVSGTASTDDYTLSPESLTLAAGASSASATLAVADDAVEEETENIVIAVSVAGAGVGSVTVRVHPSDPSSAPQAQEDPIPTSTQKGDIIVAAQPFVRAPQTADPEKPSATNDAYARIQYLKPIPGGNRLAFNDLRGILYATDADGATPVAYLDLRDQNVGFYAELFPNESGLFGFAFHPEFAKLGRPGYGKFYTSFSVKEDSGVADYLDNVGSHESVVREWTATNPTASVFAGTSREVFRIGQPRPTLDIGTLAFNPAAAEGEADYGKLYIGMGDGGGINDPDQHGQNLANPLGAILRIDPLGGNSERGYGIPADNPFADNPGVAPEIWAYGLRHPQHFSFDASGRMFINDIGEDQIEEVNIGRAGANYGWRLREGTFATAFGVDSQDTGSVFALPANDSGFEYPVAQYDHDTEGRAIGSGFLYEGETIPALKGKYVFADLVQGYLFAIDAADLTPGTPAARDELRVTFDGTERSIIEVVGQTDTYRPDVRDAKRADLRLGVDHSGELYLLTKTDGWIRRLVANSLTAKFEDMPESHDGGTAFVFRVRFSEVIRNAIASIRDRAFKVTGGSVVNASRVNGNKQHWEIKIQPAGNDDVVIALEANRGCGSGPCTKDHRRLSKRLEETVKGPASPEASITANSATVAEGASATFTVTLEAAPTEAVTVAISVEETETMLPAMVPTAVEIGAGATSAPLAVATDDDRVVESNSTVTATLSAGTGYRVGTDDSAEVVVTDNDEATFTVVAAPEEIAEGGSATVTVSVADGVTFAADQTIALSASGTAAADFTLTPTTQTLTAGDNAVTATVTATEDTEAEAAETVVVTASHNGATVGSATVTIAASDALSDDATLKTLTLSGVDLGTFSSGQTRYEATVANEVSSTTVTATPNDDEASVVIADKDGSTTGTARTVTLAEGENEITVMVTAEDGETEKTYTVTVTREKPPLTAAFEDMPETHDGETEFAFRVRFSEVIRNSIASIRDRAFKVTGGSVVKVSRVNGNKQHWEIKIQPAGDDDVVIALEANRGCGSGPCTEDRRRLAKRLEETVKGPGAGKRLSPVAESTGTPAGYALGVAYPNPFNPEITIEFSVSRDGPVKIEVFNAAGQRLSILVDETLTAGTYKTVWDGLDPNGMRVSSGVYLYRMQAGDFVATRSMTLLK